MSPDLPVFGFDYDDFISYILAICSTATAFIIAISLYRYYQDVRNSYFYNTKSKTDVSLLFISRLTWSTLLLSSSYFIAQITDIFTLGPGVHEYIWPYLELSTFIVLSLLCITAKKLVVKDFKYDIIKKQNKIIKAVITAAGGYVWYKNAEGKYIFCDPSWCKFFFGIEPDCDIVGMNDIELLGTIRKKKRHTFGELCMNTDYHARDQHKQCRYIECGYIGDKLVVLDVLKTPIFEKGKYVGNVGFAWERAKECENIFKDIKVYLKNGRAKRLADGVYWIIEPTKECKWDKPFPGSE